MDLTVFDQPSLDIIKKWNLDNLEYVLSTMTNAFIKEHPYWCDFTKYDGLSEIMICLIMVKETNDSIDASLIIVGIENKVDPLLIYRQFIQEAKMEQLINGIDNILVDRYIQMCKQEYKMCGWPHVIPPNAIALADFLSDKMALKNIYGDSWQRHYRPKVRIA